ncbi:MAG TPA: hypothetical protein VLE72_04570 [Candidatus Saccharimonadales bacterium]|nr:hypothetical protein [Candidatus Saccharimonadales bacterium]
MAKRKKSQRKRNFAYSQGQKPRSNVTEETIGTAGGEQPVIKTKPESGLDLSFVLNDLKLSGILAASCIVLELALWLLLQHSGLGHNLFG